MKRILATTLMAVFMASLYLPSAVADDGMAMFKLVNGLYERVSSAPDERYRVVIYSNSPSPDRLLSFLKENGVVVEVKSGNRLQVLALGWLLLEAAGRDDVRFVSPPRKAFSNYLSRGSYYPSTPFLTGLDELHALGYRGSGVKIGVIDGGFYGYEALLGNGLPESVEARSFRNDGCALSLCPEEKHGTAVAEVIHQVAPDAQLYLAAVQTDLEFAQAIEWFKEQGVAVVNGSIGFVGCGPKDGTGSCAQTAASLWDHGILPVFAAGNMAESHWIGQKSDADGDGLLEFSEGQEVMMFSVYQSGDVEVVVNWNDWGAQPELPSSDQDIDLFVLAYDLFTSQVSLVGASLMEQAGLPGEEPLERISFTASPDRLYFIYLQDYSTTRTFTVDVTLIGEYVLSMDPYSPQSSIISPADSPKVVAVGAATPDGIIHPYSSQGPLWNGFYKPDLAAPSGLYTTTYGWGGFYGTSASAPVVAGAAALVKQMHPDWGPAQIKKALEMWAADIDTPGQDLASGYGLVGLAQAFNYMNPPAPEGGVLMAQDREWSGITLEFHGDTYLSGVFTFAPVQEGGTPVWYASLGRYYDHFGGPADLYLFRVDQASGNLTAGIVGSFSLFYDDSGVGYCQATDSMNRELLRWRLVPAPGMTLGEGESHWWWGQDVPNHFLFTQYGGNSLASILYYFDEMGEPVWAGLSAPRSPDNWYTITQWQQVAVEGFQDPQLHAIKSAPFWIFQEDTFLTVQGDTFGLPGLVTLLPASF